MNSIAANIELKKETDTSVSSENKSTLFDTKAGFNLTIYSLPDGEIKLQLIRLGISEGAQVDCLQRLPGGTIVLQKNHQEIAIGRDLAKRIFVIRN